jgi:hypothetical protein
MIEKNIFLFESLFVLSVNKQLNISALHSYFQYDILITGIDFL